MTAGYEPEVNDYVVWDQGEHGTDEGWVYFKGDKLEHRKGFNECPRYITIETHVTDKLDCEYTKHRMHSKNHCLVLCYQSNWHQLKFIKRRKSKTDNTIISEEKNDSTDTYKSQQYRDQDLY